ncbi:MAG: hypothetical protein CAF43_007230 [Nitrospira sp. CG24C]|jgi:hypothetical protein|nr:MAG: hypothetical protein CAF43_007230 [Nitrospira sp. CG24C]
MSRTIRQFAIAGFALWLVALSGIVYPQLTAHMGQHEHHTATTHATALCSWLCIAADAVEGTSVHFAPAEQVTLVEQDLLKSQISAPLTVQPPSRAPPVS